LRKLLSILLLAVFALPLVSPLVTLRTDAESGVPACCRRNGKHHCLVNMAEHAEAAQHGVYFTAPAEKCAYCPSAVAAAHPSLLAAGISAAVYASLVSHPVGDAQTESKRRISHDRSRQKRGPPALSLV